MISCFRLPTEDDNSARTRAPAELSPIVHKVPALLEKVAASVGGLDRVADCVCERLFNNVVRVSGRFSGPVSERAAKAVDCNLALRSWTRRYGRGSFIVFSARTFTARGRSFIDLGLPVVAIMARAQDRGRSACRPHLAETMACSTFCQCIWYRECTLGYLF